jgi:hypothetical protein
VKRLFPPVTPRPFFLNIGGLMNNQFIPFSLDLAKMLSPEAFLLFAAVKWYEQKRRRVCDASNESLMKLCGFKTLRRLRKYKKELVDCCFIVPQKRPRAANCYTTLFNPVGYGMRVSFLFNPRYSPNEKMALLLKSFFPGKSIRFISTQCKISKTVLAEIFNRRHCPIVNHILIKPLKKFQNSKCPDSACKVSGNNTPSYLSKKDITTAKKCGGGLSIPDIIDLFTKAGLTNKEIYFLKTAFIKNPRVNPGKVAQASFIVFEKQKAGRVKKQDGGYGLLYGILRNNADSKGIRGAPPLADTLNKIKSDNEIAKARRVYLERMADVKAARELEAQAKRAATLEGNTKFYRALTPEVQEQIKSKVQEIGNRGGLFTFSYDRELDIALQQDIFIDEIQSVL